MEMRNESKKININEAIIITYLSGLIYLAAYFYERGYCLRFNIPFHLISPNLSTILNFGSYIIMIFFYFFIYRVDDIFDTSNNSSSVILSLVLIAFTIIAFSYQRLILWSLLVLVVTFFLVFIFRKKINKIKINIPYTINRYKFASSIVFAMLVILSSHLMGNGASVEQVEYTTIKNYKNVVVLRQYGDLLICAEFNPETKNVKEELLLINISNQDSLILKTSKVGPLSFNIEKESKNSNPTKIDSLKQKPVKKI